MSLGPALPRRRGAVEPSSTRRKAPRTQPRPLPVRPQCEKPPSHGSANHTQSQSQHEQPDSPPWRHDDLYLSLADPDAAHINAQRGYRLRPGAHPGVGSGNAPGSHTALRLAHGLTFQCPTPGCESLVNLQAAKRRARAAGRDRYALGDGCASKVCSANHKPGRFSSRQRTCATGLLHSHRLLIRRPDRTDATHVTLVSSQSTKQVAEAVLRKA